VKTVVQAFKKLVEAEPGKHLKMKMNFGMETDFSAQFHFEAVGDSTKLHGHSTKQKHLLLVAVYDYC
jgi:hypothetical protein